MQAKLLTFLEEGVIRRVGGGRQRVANVRILAATNRDLRQMVSDGQFRADLYYRLAVVHLPIPALRKMPELTDHLIDRFVDTINQRRGQKFVLPDWVRVRLTAYAWPGNVRELDNVIERAIILTEEDGIGPAQLGLNPNRTPQRVSRASLDPSEDLSLEDYFTRFVMENQDSMTETELAQKLGISRKSLWERRQRLGIPRKKASSRR